MELELPQTSSQTLSLFVSEEQKTAILPQRAQRSLQGNGRCALLFSSPVDLSEGCIYCTFPASGFLGRFNYSSFAPMLR